MYERYNILYLSRSEATSNNFINEKAQKKDDVTSICYFLNLPENLLLLFMSFFPAYKLYLFLLFISSEWNINHAPRVCKICNEIKKLVNSRIV